MENNPKKENFEPFSQILNPLFMITNENFVDITHFFVKIDIVPVWTECWGFH